MAALKRLSGGALRTRTRPHHQAAAQPARHAACGPPAFSTSTEEGAEGVCAGGRPPRPPLCLRRPGRGRAFTKRREEGTGTKGGRGCAGGRPPRPPLCLRRPGRGRASGGLAGGFAGASSAAPTQKSSIKKLIRPRRGQRPPTKKPRLRGHEPGSKMRRSARPNLPLPLLCPSPSATRHPST